MTQNQQFGGETLNCATCGEEHEFENPTGYDCLILMDGREAPVRIIAWCDESCFNQWLGSPAARELFPTM